MRKSGWVGEVTVLVTLRAGTGDPVWKRLGPGEGNHPPTRDQKNLCHWGKWETRNDLVTELGKAGPHSSASGADRKAAWSGSPGRLAPGAATGPP